MNISRRAFEQDFINLENNFHFRSDLMTVVQIYDNMSAMVSTLRSRVKEFF